MMKKIVSALIAAVMAAAMIGTAWAATVDYTLEQKLEQQLISSGLKGSVTFIADGDGFWGIDQTQWLLLRSLLPALKIDAASTVLNAERKDRETQLTVLKGGADAGQADILGNGEVIAFSSDLIGGGVYYALSQNADLTRILGIAGEGSWPGVWHLFYELAAADGKWQERAQSAASNYLTKVGLWFQSYQEVTTDIVNGELQITQHCEISGNEIKTEMKQLMVDLYSDQEMLALLAEIFTPEESAAYLQPSMMSALFSVMDAIDLDSNVIIERVYDSRGTCLKDTITLPFGTESRISYVTLTVKGADLEREYAVTGAWRDTEDDGALYPFMLSVIPVGAEGIYSGSVSIGYPIRQSDEFTVDDAAPTSGKLEAEFAMGIDMGEETYTASEDLCQRERSLTLTLRPMPGDTTGLHTISLSMNLLLYSNSRRQAATNIQASLTMTDQELGGYIGLEATFRTASKWTPTLVSDLKTAPVRLDLMDESRLAQTRLEWLSNLIGWLTTNFLGAGN